MIRRRITVQGIVQGVGFRPFVYRQARACKLSGLVANTPDGVVIEVQGEPSALDAFTSALRGQAPPHALIISLTQSELPPTAETDFRIAESCDQGPAATLIAPDLCTCDDCLHELFDPQDRRYRYPFINCTNCGPRFTIIGAIPYDRPATTMAAFTMCPACQAEYDDPENRRFHAQPNACPVCGPRLALCDAHGRELAPEAIAAGAELLAAGQILAIKGLGGFHLAVDPANEAAVSRLRSRKGRAAKPLALMVADLDMAASICHLGPAEASLLASPQRPIVLLAKRDEAGLSPMVAPKVNEFGVMLPYTPLHHLLLDACRRPLVMTSANLSDEPLCQTNLEAMGRLADIADAFLLHDRDIAQRTDDSVVRPGPRGGMRVLRRSRGLAPTPIPVAVQGPQVLAVGGELKNTICLLKGEQAFISQHLGDLKNLTAYDFFSATIDHFLRIFSGAPGRIVHDLHPGYLSSRWALGQRLPTLAVQHHHAHLAACLAENLHPGPAIGVILDGTGYGPDHTIWGGEILIGDFAGYERYAAFEPLPLPGGERAIREPWRTAVGYLVATFGHELPALDFLTRHHWQPVAEISSHPRLSPLTSSGGRLFDAVAAMSGGCQVASYEGQAAIELMAAAGPELGPTEGYQTAILDTADGRRLAVRPLLRQVVADLQGGTSLGTISRKFHRSLIALLAQAVRQAAHDSGLATVALAGGVFANPLLLSGLSAALRDQGLTVLSHAKLPPGDGSLALGQAMIGRTHLTTATTSTWSD